MPGQSTTVLEAPAAPTGGTTSTSFDRPARERARPLSTPGLGIRRAQGLAETLLLIGVVAVGGPVILVSAGTIALLALALAGPFLLPAILVLALALVVFAAIGAAA
jgi:hypothetical protein